MTALDTIAKAIASQDKDESLQEQKESRRLKMAPFQTKFAPFSEKTLDELRGWRPPNGDDAYILFEKKMIERGDRAPDTIVYTLHVMLVGSRPDQFEKLRYNMEVKGMKIIHYDRFPKINDSNAVRARLAAMHFDPQRQQTAYDALEDLILRYANDDKTSLAEKLAEAEAQNADLRSKLEKKRVAEAAKGDRGAQA